VTKGPAVEIRDLPLLNAVLNSLSTVLLLLGFYSIRTHRKSRHRLFMLAALITSCLFLASYIVYHFNVGSVKFIGQGTVRAIYFTILISHTVLAIAVPPLAIVTLVRALRERFDRHKHIARWTLPVWLYVSITGVAIYIMLYQLYPSAL
jgi:uncharacterized membrane protein YozB (DUF420 family)